MGEGGSSKIFRITRGARVKISDEEGGSLDIAETTDQIPPAPTP